MPCGGQPFFPAGNPRPTLTVVCDSSMYSPFALDVPLFAAVFTTIWRHANRSVHILIRPPLPNQRSESYIACSASSKLRPPENLTSAVSSVLTPYSAAFTLKHRECKQSSAPRRGGLLLRGSAPMRSWFLPLCGHPPRKQTLALGSCLTLAPSGWCALRDSGHQRRFFHVCIC